MRLGVQESNGRYVIEFKLFLRFSLERRCVLIHDVCPQCKCGTVDFYAVQLSPASPYPRPVALLLPQLAISADMARCIRVFFCSLFFSRNVLPPETASLIAFLYFSCVQTVGAHSQGLARLRRPRPRPSGQHASTTTFRPTYWHSTAARRCARDPPTTARARRALAQRAPGTARVLLHPAQHLRRRP